MERLPFETDGAYAGIEAAIHIARYSFVRTLCRGKKVLDVACGEGYGSRLLLDWGAREVVGVDRSAIAIDRAKSLFGTPGIRYFCGDAHCVDQLLDGEKFDLIISIETLEHLDKPIEFLSAINTLRAQDGCVVVSCPNDWWYYPQPEQRNEFHIRKYFHDEFVELLTEGLGKPDTLGLGTPIIGFANLPLGAVSDCPPAASQLEMMRATAHEGGLVVPAEAGSVSVRTASYFLAAWGVSPSQIMGSAMLPISMDSFSSGVWQAKVANQDHEREKSELLLKLQSTEAKLDAAIKVNEELQRCLTGGTDATAKDSTAESTLVESLREELQEQRLVAQKFRNQAAALFQEVAILQEKPPECVPVTVQFEGSDEKMGASIAELRRLVAEKDRTIADLQLHLNALAKRWRAVTAVPRKLVPAALLPRIKRTLQWLNSKL